MKRKRDDQPDLRGWVPYVNPSTGYTCDYQSLSSCCQNGVHHGWWHGKPGWMCQACGRRCERIPSR